MPQAGKLDHIPVLADEILAALAPKKGESYLDLTAGLGGHAALILAKTANEKLATLVDRDAVAVKELVSKFPNARVIQSDFLDASRELADKSVKFDLILADLGVSSVHLNDTNRGFSFTAEAPLDMRMDSSQELMAADVVNSYKEDRLAKLLKDFGEEPKAHQIARLIVRNRPVKTTAQLAAIAKRAWPGRSKTHPATRLFQAVRIEVNGELEQLEKGLPLWLELLAPGGRLAVISFHSLEDRIVKQFLAEHSSGYGAELALINKKPISAGKKEIAFNPRSRSAKLRSAVKINNRSP